jgi:Coenzyme PQQ synthesis protein D (PqqD)
VGNIVDNLYCRSASIEAAPLQDETILFNPERKQFCVLNRTASLIWDQLATPTTTENLAAHVCKSFSGVSMEVVLRDADRTVQEMLTLNFVARHSAEGEQK